MCRLPLIAMCDLSGFAIRLWATAANEEAMKKRVRVLAGWSHSPRRIPTTQHDAPHYITPKHNNYW